MTVRFGGSAALAAALLSGVLSAPVAAAAERHAPAATKRADARLLQLPPAERAAVLARAVGHWCIGTEAFPMGVITKGLGEGNAYWSLRCTDGTTWAVQINPAAEITAIDCASFKELGQGKECFKKF